MRGWRMAWLAVGLVLAWSMPALAGKIVPLDEIKIAVNNKALTKREVAEYRALQTQQIQRQFEGEEQQRQLQQLDEQMTQMLIEDLLIESYAERLNIDVSDKEIEDRVDNIVRRQPELQDVYTDEQLKAFVLKDLLRRQVLNREVESRVHVSETDVEAACRDRRQDTREVEVGHILVRGDEAEARKKLEQIRQELQQGADFEQLALKYSEDPSVATNKGRLGFISHGQFVKPFEDAAFALPLGAVSEPVKTRFGLHLIKVFDERTKGALNCDELNDVERQSLRNKLLSERRQKRLDDFLARLREHAEIKVYE